MSDTPSSDPATNATPNLPVGWSDGQLRDILDHYENQSEDEAIIELEEAEDVDPPYDLGEDAGEWIEVPKELVPKVRELINKAQTA